MMVTVEATGLYILSLDAKTRPDAPDQVERLERDLGWRTQAKAVRASSLTQLTISSHLLWIPRGIDHLLMYQVPQNWKSLCRKSVGVDEFMTWEHDMHGGCMSIM